jgi:hypothetical protein
VIIQQRPPDVKKIRFGPDGGSTNGAAIRLRPRDNCVNEWENRWKNMRKYEYAGKRIKMGNECSRECRHEWRVAGEGRMAVACALKAGTPGAGAVRMLPGSKRQIWPSGASRGGRRKQARLPLACQQDARAAAPHSRSRGSGLVSAMRWRAHSSAARMAGSAFSAVPSPRATN